MTALIALADWAIALRGVILTVRSTQKRCKTAATSSPCTVYCITELLQAACCKPGAYSVYISSLLAVYCCTLCISSVNICRIPGRIKLAKLSQLENLPAIMRKSPALPSGSGASGIAMKPSVWGQRAKIIPGAAHVSRARRLALAVDCCTSPATSTSFRAAACMHCIRMCRSLSADPLGEEPVAPVGGGLYPLVGRYLAHASPNHPRSR